MEALDAILKSRKQSVRKLQLAVESLEKLLASCQVEGREVLKREIAVRRARLDKLQEEVRALEKELERLRPPLPLEAAKNGPKGR